MGSQSFLLISCVADKNIEAAKELNKIYGVKEAVPVYGTYDCIAKTDKLEPGEVNTLVSSNIRPLEQVSSVLVLREEMPTNGRGLEN
ncbi:MAG: hypothetical protein GWN01_05380 [Nitrosopumilaceae archaeon]|nr:hypothetical protein [Nitrosopumilaceae archaeon]NIU00375.1 hypothetical protein [Nitrosopumilaceae archaeon]NIU86777.1 hypothetical protein [Nitrosopumilaceae archaeon]NIV65477.1 hypothetical protein [Nitrosopumilaceae archaeon]NIX60977.1 hypothetical protein [Nitrosopumilaceae archaeon]